VDIEDALLGSIECIIAVMGLVSFLLDCNASNLVLEILKHNKIQGTICISIMCSIFRVIRFTKGSNS